MYNLLEDILKIITPYELTSREINRLKVLQKYIPDDAIIDLNVVDYNVKLPTFINKYQEANYNRVTKGLMFSHKALKIQFNNYVLLLRLYEKNKITTNSKKKGRNYSK